MWTATPKPAAPIAPPSRPEARPAPGPLDLERLIALASPDLGRRIVEAARLAAALHHFVGGSDLEGNPMIYGLYLSAAGVISSSYRQDVIANNLANSETVGFKRDLPLFQERLTEAQQRRGARPSDPTLEGLGGGLFAAPSLVDNRAGDLEHTGSPLDVAVQGDGYFAVDDHGQTRLTRNGRFMVNRDGQLTLSDMPGHKVLGADGSPVQLAPGGTVSVDTNGTIIRDGQAVARLGVFNVPHPDKLSKQGGTLLAYPDRQEIKPVEATVRSETIERFNVDPTAEMAELMDAQRQLEANANMIRYQDQTLQLLCNNVGKIS